MESFSNPAVIWFLIGFVLFILEFAVPGFILFFFGVGAWLVAILCFLFDIPVNMQLIVFLAGSILTTLLFRKWVKKLVLGKKQTSEIEDELIGKTGKVMNIIAPGHDGKIEFKGTIWDARSTEVLQPGEIVIITGNESILLFVKSTKPQL